MAARDADPLLAGANAQAAASVGYSPFDGESAAAPESAGIESDLMDYLEALWTQGDGALTGRAEI